MKCYKIRRVAAYFIILCLMAACLTACSGGGNGNGNENKEEPTATAEPTPTQTQRNQQNWGGFNYSDRFNNQRNDVQTAVTNESISRLAEEQNRKVEVVHNVKDLELRFYEDKTFEFKQNNKFYTDDVKLSIVFPEGTKVYYTLDGREPDETSIPYEAPLEFQARGGNFPDAYTFRACMIDGDGKKSDVAKRTYLVGKNLDGRFSTMVIFLSGDPAKLTDEPDGILYGENVFLRGRDYEREVYIEAFEADGTPVFAQDGGVRVYGGYSRNAVIKSLKIYARKSYDEAHKNFKMSDFNTPKLYKTEEGKSPVITKYDRLVMRNSGNDNQFCYIRDELSQRLVKAAGFETYEGVLPVVCYLNGSYYSLLWLHESYCDKYFKEKYGDAEGEFIILEGGDQKKNDDDELQSYVDEYNAKYESFVNSDLKDDEVYNSLCEFIDINSYLDFFAWNIALNNWDWPNNNYKCFRYVPEEGGELGTGVFDGKWRFLPHDMDYTYGIFDQAKAKENYNTLKVVMDKNNERYSPLFTKLMERKDCREYFRAKTFEYLNGAQSEKTIKEEYEKLHASRLKELKYYYDFLQILNMKGFWDIWSKPEHYVGYEKQIYTFAEKRAGYVIKYMNDLLPTL